MGRVSEAIMPRLHLAVGCLIWLFALSRAVEDRMEAMDQVELSGYLGKQPDEAGGECATEVKMAKAKCAAGAARLKEIVGSDCGSKHLRTIVTTLTTNHNMAQNLQQQLLQAQQSLSTIVSHSTTVITHEHRTESHVLHQMVELKSRQHQFAEEQRRTKETQTAEDQLFKRAQQATQDAVNHAKSSDDRSTTVGMRDKASDLFQQYVHKRVQLASLERKALMSKDGITKTTEAVKEQEEKATKAMAAKKKTLDEIAQAKLKVAKLAKSVAQQEVATAKMEVQASEEEKTMLQKKVDTAKKIQHTAAKSLDHSQAKARKTEKLASAATKMVEETEDMSLKALLAQSEDMGLDDPARRE